MLQAWDGSYALEVITDATYTYTGMDFDHRERNLKGTNRDIWKILYAELDYTLLTAVGHIEITKIKSHSDGTHLYNRMTHCGIWG